ncbi:MAG TPA: NADH-quinone oxidoreductase subunit J [Acidimicrobiia bacterium]|jgi:NADH-quinone oxidoreductase subunit J
MAEFVIFFIMAAIALGAAIGMVIARNPVHSALLLVTVLIAIAVMFLLQDAQLLAAVQIIVYAGAIVVLFLFVIMLLGVDRSESLEDPVRSQRPAAIVLGIIGVAEVLFLAGRHWSTGATGAGLHAGSGGNVQNVARAIFTDYLWPFEVLTILLVVAVVGGVVLARRSGLPAEQEYDLERDDDVTTPSDLDPEDSPTEATTP